MKNLLYILFGIVLAYSIYITIDSFKSNSEIDYLKLKYKNEISNINKRNLLLEDKINKSVEIIADLEGDVENLNTSTLKHIKSAAKYKSNYETLLNETPETIHSKLLNCEGRNNILLNVVKSQDTIIIKKDSVISIKNIIIKELKLISITKDTIVINKDKIIAAQKEEIRKLSDIFKKDKRKTFIKGLGVGGTIVAVAVIIILI